MILRDIDAPSFPHRQPEGKPSRISDTPPVAVTLDPAVALQHLQVKLGRHRRSGARSFPYCAQVVSEANELHCRQPHWYSMDFISGQMPTWPMPQCGHALGVLLLVIAGTYL
jgi:hypothetical protein